MKILQAYWLRFWHCLYHTIKELSSDHRMYTEKSDIITPYIGCSCGKGYYGKRMISREAFDEMAAILKEANIEESKRYVPTDGTK